MNVFVMHGMSDTGRVRQNNEDAYAAIPDIGLAVVADGMGGHKAGEVASAMAIDVITRSLAERLPSTRRVKRTRIPEIVRNAIELANSAVYEAANTNRDYAGMGSTVVVTAFHGDRVCIAHVGDSRLYRLRGGVLQQLTEDHSVVQDLLRRGLISPEQARTSPNKNVITRALGVTRTVEVTVRDERVQQGDLYLLCTDGLHDMLTDENIASLLRVGVDDITDLAARLIDAANQAGGDDNVTTVVVRVQNRQARTRGHEQRAA